jgi:hypothetical protein
MLRGKRGGGVENCYTLSVDKIFATLRTATPMAVAAALSVVMLASVALWQATSSYREKSEATAYSASPLASTTGEKKGLDWQQEMILLGLDAEYDPSATSSGDSLALIGPAVMAQLIGEYSGLQEQGIYTPEAGAAAAAQIAGRMWAALSYKTYTRAEIPTDTDTSYARAMQYRTDLQKSLVPLMDNDDYELDFLARYSATGDAKYLDDMRAVAADYREAARLTSQIVVPQDAVDMHIAILGAMEYFAAVLEQLAAHVDDPFAAAALIRTYNDAEYAMLSSFGQLGPYYRSKHL